MNRYFMFPVMICAVFILIPGCSGGNLNPTAPQTVSLNSQSELTIAGSSPGMIHQTLMGFFDASFDSDSGELLITPNRNVSGLINAVNFFNNNPSKLTTANLTITPSSPPGSYVDADIDIRLQHPFSGVPKFNGYDLRMAVITNGTGTMAHNSALEFGISGTDVMLLEDPVNMDGGGPDGYTRWFNPVEFLSPGLLGYTAGVIATVDYTASGTLNPYKLFADGITSHEDAFEFMRDGGGPGNNVFASGNIPVSRNMYLRFPIGSAPVIKYNYALIASWDGAQFPNPVNATEVVAASVTVTDEIYYVSGTENGGDLILAISLAGYGEQPSTIIIESTVMSAPYTLDSGEMIPVTSGTNYETYNVTIQDVDNVQGTDGNEFWVIAQYNGADKTVYGYQNTYGTANLAGTDPLEACFRYDLEVSDIPPSTSPVCDLQVTSGTPYTGPGPHNVQFDASGSTDDSAIVLYEYDFQGSGYISYGTNATVWYFYNASYSGPVWVRLTDDDGETSECSVTVNITITGTWSNKNIILRNHQPYDLAVNHNNGDLLVLYSDGQVWKYTEANSYSSGTLHFITSTIHEYIDTASDNRTVVCGNWPNGSSATIRSYTQDGLSYTSMIWDYTWGIKDAVAMTTTALNSWMGAAGATNAANPVWRARTYLPYAYTSYYWHGRMVSDYPYICTADAFISFESSNQTNAIYYTLEGAPEFDVDYYQGVSTGPYGIGSGLSTYLGEWGGVQADNMTGFNNPRDLTRDNNNNYYVLDKLSPVFMNAPVVKKYSSTGTPFGPFGDSSTIVGEPLRIEGSDYNGRIFVLHFDSGIFALLSIFDQAEIPQ